MDPNATLSRIRELTAGLDTSTTDEANELAELITALDEWLSKGGFLPSEWVTVPATTYDIDTHEPLPLHVAALRSAPVNLLDGKVFDAHAAFAANDLGEETAA